MCGKQAEKIGRAYELAEKIGCPVVGIFDSNGGKLDNGIESVSAFSQLINFSNLLEKRYFKLLQSERYTLHRLKEIWIYMMENYPEEKKILKAVKKDANLDMNKLVDYLGGKDNIINAECNMSRFKVILKDVSIVDKPAIQKLSPVIPHSINISINKQYVYL